MTTPDTAACACGHLVLVHVLNPRTKKRGTCSHMDQKGQCPCPGPR